MSELTPGPPADRIVKIPHLVFGLLFLGIAGIWALVVTDVITDDRLPILAPAVLIVAGVIGLAVSLASTRNRRQRHQGRFSQTEPYVADEPVEHDSDHDPDLDQTREIR
jgi:hypothetical protein